MSLPQDDSFLYSPRQNYRNNIGLVENPMGMKHDFPQASFSQKSHSNNQLQHRNPSAGRQYAQVFSNHLP